MKRSSSTRRGRLWISSESWRIAVSAIPHPGFYAGPILFISARLSLHSHLSFPSSSSSTTKALDILSLSLSPSGHCIARHHSLVPELFPLYHRSFLRPSLPSLVVSAPSFHPFRLNPILCILPYLIYYQHSFNRTALYSTSISGLKPIVTQAILLSTLLLRKISSTKTSTK